HSPVRPAQPAVEGRVAVARVQRHQRGEAGARLARRQRRDQGSGGGEEIPLLSALRTGGEVGVDLVPLGGEEATRQERLEPVGNVSHTSPRQNRQRAKR